MATFQEILNKKAASIEPPKPLPVGTYLCLISGQPEFGKIGKNNVDHVDFPLKFIQADNDVDQHMLQESLHQKDGTYKALQDYKQSLRFFMTDDAVWRIVKFLVEDLGLDEEKSLAQLIPEAMGRQVYVTFGHRASDDGSRVFMDPRGTRKV